jgi:hypothetical protein
MRVRSLLNLLLLVTMLEVATVWTATAEMRVIESNVAEYPVGTLLHDNEPLNLRPGSRVRVLLPNNETKVFQGPASSEPSYGGVRGPRKPD